MTNTQIMELLRNKAINADTKKALLIAAGIIVVGGIAIYYYSKNQQNIVESMKIRHANYENLSENKINELGATINQKDDMLAEKDAIIKELQDKNIILQNINEIKAVKV